MTISAAASALTSITQHLTAPTNGLKRAKPVEVSTEAESAQKTSQQWVQKNLSEKLRGEFRQKVLEQRSLTDDAAKNLTAAARSDAAKGIIAQGEKEHARTASQGELESRAKAASGQELPPPATLLDIKV